MTRRIGTSAGYSLGMRQRLGLAAALLGDPELLILDEPGNGLDPEGMRWLRDFLRAFADRGRSVFVSSHHLAEVAQTVDRVVIINRGRLVVEAPLRALTAGEPASLEDLFLDLDRGAGGMSDQLASELLKLRTTRTLALLLLAAGAMSLFGVWSRRSRAMSASSRRRRRSATCSARV